MGYVYLFNLAVQPLRLSFVDQQSQTTPIQPSTRPPYVPFEIQVVRSNQPVGGPAFYDGQTNRVAVQLQTRQSTPIDLPVPATAASTDDLWLYVAYDLLVLFTTEGTISAQAPVVWDSSAASAAPHPPKDT